MPMQIRAVSEEGREVELSFSSENPVDRWFGPEILCHDEGCVDLSRLENVGSVLFHHGKDPVYGSLPIAKNQKYFHRWENQARESGRCFR